MMIFVTILQLLAALVLIGIVLFQSGKSQGLSGTIGGIADSYMAKSKAKSLDAKLAKATKWVGAAFIVLTLVIFTKFIFRSSNSTEKGKQPNGKTDS